VAAGDHDRVFRIDAAYGRVTGAAHLAPGYVLSGLGARAIASRGNDVWVANYDATAVQISPTTLRTKKRVLVGGQSLPGVAGRVAALSLSPAGGYSERRARAYPPGRPGAVPSSITRTGGWGSPRETHAPRRTPVRSRERHAHETSERAARRRTAR
jgi:hypothetical protein